MMENTNSSVDFNVERAINILQTGDKFQKKQIFSDMVVFFRNCAPDILETKFNNLLISISIAFQEKAEMCREGAINACIEAVGKLEPNVEYVSSLVPAIHSRLCSENLLEPSEELRLKYIELASLLIETHHDLVMPYLEDLLEILAQGIFDSAPEVKKKSCFSSIQLARLSALKYNVHLKKLVQPLSSAIKHQHWRVRVAVIEALDVIILKGDPKILPDALPALTNRFFDDNSHVRLALTKLIGNWMLNHYDRYSYFSQMLPLILTSLCDNDEKVRTEGYELWNKVGIQYMQENEKDLKDKIDWIVTNLDHYPAGVVRPCLGCRTLVEREVGKFALAIGRELNDWVVSVRIKSTQLLSQVILHAEDKIIQDLHKIIVPMTKAAMDKEAPAVVQYVMLAAEYLGYFVPPKVYCPLIIEYIHDANYGELRIVSSVIKGSKAGELQPFLSKITHLLDGSTFKGDEQLARLDLIRALFTVCGSGCFEIGDSLFGSLVTVAGLAVSEDISGKANELLDEFSRFGEGGRRNVFNRFCKSVFASLIENHWTANCPEQFIFTAIVCYTGEVIEENVDTVLEIFRKCLYKESTDPECVLKVIVALNKLISQENLTLPTSEVREKFKNTILEEVLCEHLKWKAGRSAEAIRTMATTSLFMLLPRQIPEKLLPILLSLVEDASPKTRQLALACIAKCSFLTGLHASDIFSKIITVSLKRLDDCDQRVREIGLKCVVDFYKEEKKQKENENISVPLLEFVCSTMLIHLDDQDSKFQNSVLVGLQEIGMLNPELLLKKIRVDKFRDKEIANQLVLFLEQLARNASMNA